MKRIDADAFVGITSSHGVTPVNGFGGGDPTVPTNPTEVDETWLNNVQEEIMTILDAAAVAPNGAVFNQLLASLQALFVTQGGAVMGGNYQVNGSLTVDFGADFVQGATLEQRSSAITDFASALAANEISARAVHKAHAVVTLNASASPSLSAADSYNVSGVSVATNALIVTFAAGGNFFASGAKPCVTVTIGSELLGVSFVLATANRALSDRTRAVINFSDASATILNAAAAGLNGLTVNVHVEGKQ